jgi:hypothetical protein
VGGTAADLLTVGLRYNPFVAPALVHPPTAATTFLQQDPELFRVTAPSTADPDRAGPPSPDPAAQWAFPWAFSLDPLPPNTNMPYRLQVIGGYDSISLASYHAYLQLVEGRPDQDVDVPTTYDSPLLDLANVKYVLTDRALQSPNLALVFEARGTKIYRNRAVLPRAFIVPAAQVLPEAPLHAALRAPHFDPRAAVLLHDPPVGAPVGGGRGEARVVTYRPEEVVLDTTVTGGGGWLVLSDAFYPGWEATVDGHPVKIYQANAAFRALPLFAGTHRVRFVYRPRSFRLGAAISLGTLLLLGLLLGYGRWRHARKEPNERPA